MVIRLIHHYRAVAETQQMSVPLLLPPVAWSEVAYMHLPPRVFFRGTRYRRKLSHSLSYLTRVATRNWS